MNITFTDIQGKRQASVQEAVEGTIDGLENDPQGIMAEPRMGAELRTKRFLGELTAMLVEKGVLDDDDLRRLLSMHYQIERSA